MVNLKILKKIDRKFLKIFWSQIFFHFFSLKTCFLGVLDNLRQNIVFYDTVRYFLF